ncbi:MAG: tetratricopeptide repeat protein [Bacteroidota bacterium]
MYQKNGFLLAFFLTIAIGNQISYAQSLGRIDSLRIELNRASETEKFDVLWGLAYELFDVNNVEASVYARKAFEFAQSRKDSVQIVKSGRILGQILRRVGEVDESIKILESVLTISINHKVEKETKLILNAIAISYVLKAEYDKALEYHFKSLVIREKEGDKKQISITLNNIGIVYYRLGNFDLALDYYLQALKVKEEAGDTFQLDRTLINTGLCYNFLHNYEKAQEYFNKGFEACGSLCDTQIEVEGKFGLGVSFFGLKEYETAERYHKESLELSIKDNNQAFEQENIIELVRIYLVLNDLVNANIYLKRMDDFKEKLNFKESLLSLYEVSADFYTKTRDFERANLFNENILF